MYPPLRHLSISLGYILRVEYLYCRVAPCYRFLIPVPNYLLERSLSSPTPGQSVAYSPCVLNGFSLDLFKAKTTLGRRRFHWICWRTPGRRMNIVGTSGRASSSLSPTQPALGAQPHSQAQPLTSSCLASSRGRKQESPPAGRVLLLPSSSLLHSTSRECVLRAFSGPDSANTAIHKIQ